MRARARTCVCIFAKLFGEFNVAIGTRVFLDGARRQRVQYECMCACASCWVAAGKLSPSSPFHRHLHHLLFLPSARLQSLVSCLTASLLLLFITFSLSHTSSYTFLSLFIRSFCTSLLYFGFAATQIPPASLFPSSIIATFSTIIYSSVFLPKMLLSRLFSPFKPARLSL